MGVDGGETDLASEEELAALAAAVKRGERSLADPETTRALTCTGTDFLRLCEANPDPRFVSFAGRIVGDLVLRDESPFDGALDLVEMAHLTGELRLVGAASLQELRLTDSARIGGQLHIRGKSEIEGQIELSGHASLGSLELRGAAKVGAGVTVEDKARILGDIELRNEAQVGSALVVRGESAVGSLRLADTSSIGDGLVLDERSLINGEVCVADRAQLKARIHLAGRAVLDGPLKILDNSQVGRVMLFSESKIRQAVTIENTATTSTILIADKSSIGGRVSLGDNAKVSGHLAVGAEASLNGDLVIRGPVEVAGDLQLAGSIAGDVALTGAGHVEGDVIVSETARISGAVSSTERFKVDGDLRVTGQATAVTLRGSVEGDTVITPVHNADGPTSIGALGAARGLVRIGDNATLEHCDFRGFADYEQLRIVGSSAFGSGSRKALTFASEDGQPHGATELEKASIYRQLRLLLEKQGNRSGAGDLYYAETEARRKSLPAGSAERSILTGYKLISAYGTRALRSIACFVGLVFVAAGLLAINDVALLAPYGEAQPGSDPVRTLGDSGWTWSEVASLLRFTAQSMVSFFSPPSNATLSNTEGWIQLSLRFAGPLLIAQAVLAVRERVVR